MALRLEKHNVKLAKDRALKERHKLKSAFIVSKRKNLSGFKGEDFKEFDARQLASHGWKHRNCGQDYFTINPQGAVSILFYFH